MEQRKLEEMKSDLSPEGFVRNPQRRALIERWQKWIPQKLAKNPYQQWVLSQLYENQLGELKAFKEKHVLGEDTTTVNTAPFIKYTFPLLRRVWPSLIAPEIVSVQPMSAPVGAVFYFELKYGNTKGQVTAGQKLVKNFNRNYSSEYIDGETIGTGTGAQTTFTGYSLQWTPLRPTFLTVVAGAVSGIDDGNGNITGTGIAAGSTINYTTGAIVVNFSAAPANGVAVQAFYTFNMEANPLVPAINIDIALVAVTAKSRKLKSLWSSEAADDLKALHGVDAEQELVAGVGSELALEIDREIIEDLRAGNTGATTSFDLTIPSGQRDIDHYRAIFTPLSLISNQIGKNTLRGPANFMVMSYDLASVVEQIGTDAFYRPAFAAANAEALAPAEAPQTWGIMKMGTLQQRWMAYKDPYLTANQVVVGYKGSSFVDAGYVWAPYVPLQVTATFLDPNDFRFRKGLRTRYAKLLARPEFYGLLNVLNLTSLTPGLFGPDQVIPGF
jgi:Major capsid protein Gp23